jgi:hypothetical protein
MRIRVDDNGNILLIDYSDTILIDTIELTEWPEDLELGVIEGYYKFINGFIVLVEQD